MSQLLFLKNSVQLDAVRAQRPELLSQAEIVALSFRAWLELREAGQQAIAASELLQESDLHEISDAARQAARAWSAVNPAWEYRGLNLADLVWLENWHFFREALAAQRIAQRLAGKYRQAFLFSAGQTPCWRSARANATHDVCEAVLSVALQAQGVAVTNLFAPARGRWPLLPVKYKRLALHALRFLRQPRRVAPAAPVAPPFEAPQLIAGKRLLLALGEEVDVAALSPVVELLNSAGDYQAVLVNTGQDVPPLPGRAGVNTPSQAYSLQAWYPSEARAVAASEKAKLAQALRLALGDGLSARELSFHFDAFAQRLTEDVMPHIARVERLLQDTKPEIVLVAGCEQATDRATVRLARRNGIRTVGIPHGYLGTVEAFDFETDHFLAWGEDARACLIKELQKPPERIEVLGPLHLNRLAVPPNADAPAEKRLLVLTSRTTPVCYDTVDPNAVAAAWAALLAFVEQARVPLTIKAHPGGADQVAWYERLCGRLPEGLGRVEVKRRMEEVAAETRAVVMMIDPSTALLVAQQLRLPTLFVRVGWRVPLWAVRAWGLPDGLESVDKVEDIAPACARLWRDEDFRQRAVARGQSLLARNLAGHEANDAAAEWRGFLSRAERRDALCRS